jgi:hypothetical protein
MFVIKDTLGKGKGLFSLLAFPKNTVLAKFAGVKINKEDIEDFSGQDAACLLQIGEDLYLDLDGHSEYFINHSCNPNCFIKIAAKKAFLISLRPIAKGEELTYDYSATSTEDTDTWEMDCNCSQFYCRKNITGYKSLPLPKQMEYKEKDIFPKYIKELI